MSVEIKTAVIEPARLTFDNVRDRIGAGKVPTRYQEGVFDLQQKVGFHYRPTWDPEHDLYDVRRTAVKMEDFDQLLDPRQYYYGAYTIQRARQQEPQEANFEFVEKRGLFASLAPEWAEKIRRLIIPLRHAEWGANTNNCYISAYCYGEPIASAAILHTMDRLGLAQYITRIGLVLDGNDPKTLDNAKELWMRDPVWQGPRRLFEDAMVTRDWFELHVLQNFLIDGYMHPLAFDHFDKAIAGHGGAAFSLLTGFFVEWYGEAKRWTDAIIKVAAAASEDNRRLIEGWIGTWQPRVHDAFAPLAEAMLGGGATVALRTMESELAHRAAKIL